MCERQRSARVSLDERVVNVTIVRTLLVVPREALQHHLLSRGEKQKKKNTFNAEVDLLHLLGVV